MSLKDPEADIEKQFYTMGEVSTMLNENTSLVRFWVNELKIFKLKTNKKGNRLFTKNDLEKLKEVHFLIKTKGFTLPGARQAMKSKENMKEDKKELILRHLYEIRTSLLNMKDEHSKLKK